MAGPAGESSIDHNVQLVIDDIRALRHELERGSDEATASHLTQLTAGYLVVNRRVLDRAFAAWRDTSEQQLRQMCAQVRTLDEAAMTHQFEAVARHLIPLAPDILRTASVNLERISEDDLNMLLRVLEYAKYLADCSQEIVRWHPLPLTDAGDRIEQLRDSLPAE
jgi:hypothetical protein